MLPDWLLQEEKYMPLRDSGMFAWKTIRQIGAALTRIKIQRGHEKGKPIPAVLKLVLLIAGILTLSISRHPIVLLIAGAVLLGYLCTWPAEDIWSILKSSLIAVFFALLMFLPAMIFHPAGIPNNLRVLIKVFFCVMMTAIFHHTTQWNHVTEALRKLHIPGVFVFILDITLKYIVLLGKLINDLLTSLILRSVGKNEKKYASVGGVMGVVFVRGSEMNSRMYEAMQCRGFTDDYKGL